MDRNLAEVKQVAQKVNFRNGVTESLKFVSISYSIQMETQPTEVTCGPTCLSGMYRFLGSPVSIDDIIQQVTFVKGGGTLRYT